MFVAAREIQCLTSFKDAHPRVCLIKLIVVPSAATELFFSNAVTLFGIDMFGGKSFTAGKLTVPYSLNDKE